MNLDHRQILDRWSEWVLTTQSERYAKRRGSRLEDLKRFYDEISPVMGDLLGTLDRKPLAELDELESRLLCICLSWVEVASAVELFDDVDARHSMPGHRFAIAARGGRPVHPQSGRKGYDP